MKSRKILGLFFTCFISLNIPCYSQESIKPIVRNELYGQDINMDLFEVDDGFIDATVLTIYIDSQGFLWMGGFNWLAKYDGSKYTTYRISNIDSTGFCGELVQCICEDHQGNIWIGTQGGLGKLDQRSRTFAHYFPDPGGPASGKNSITCIYEDRAGRLWILTNESILQLNRKTGVFRDYITDSHLIRPSLVPDATPAHILEDHAGRIWIPTDKGLYLYETKHDRFRIFQHDPGNPHSISSNKLSEIVEDQNGTLWCSTYDQGVNRIDDLDQGIFTRIIPHVRKEARERFDSITRILFDQQEKLWVAGKSVFFSIHTNTLATECYDVKESSEPFDIQTMLLGKDPSIWMINHQYGGMFRFMPEKKVLYRYQSLYYSLSQLVMEPSGAIWAATVPRFALRIDPVHVPFVVLYIDHSTTLKAYEIQRIAEAKGLIWIAASSGLRQLPVYKMSNKPLNLTHFYFGDGNDIKCIYAEDENNLWFGSDDGNIRHYNIQTKSSDLYVLPVAPFGLYDRAIREIQSDGHDNLWISGVWYLCKMNKFTGEIKQIILSRDENGKVQNMFIWDMLVDSHDQVWVSTMDGVYRLDAKGEILNHYRTVIGDPQNLLNNYFTRIKEDHDGILWFVSCVNDPIIYDRQKDTFSLAPIREAGLAGIQINDLLIDKKNRKWFLTNYGMTVVSPDNKSSNSIVLRKIVTEPFLFECSTGDIFLLESGRLFIFNDTIPLNTDIPPIKITSLRINNSEYGNLFPDSVNLPALHTLDLDHTQNHLRFEFTAINYLDPAENRFKYRMVGIDPDTITSDKLRFAEYKGMKPGKYRFWVTGSNNDGLWNPNGIAIDIRIHPPWYQSGVAYGSYFLLLFLTLFTYVWLRISSLRLEKVRLGKLVRERTMELEEKNRQISEMDQLKTHFFTDISHEIRTPLSLILGPIDNLIREQIKNSRGIGWLQMMQRNGQRLLRLVNQLLDISRLDTGTMKLVLSEDDINKYIRILAYEYQSMAERRHINFVVDVTDEKYKTWFDREKVEKVIFNLLSNAFKFTPAKGIVRIRGRIQETQGNRALLEISVADNGPGIQREHLEKIFDRFYRVEGHWEKDGSGTGIGLALTRELVTLMKGEINVTSTLGKGTEFVVTIPLGRDHLKNDEYIISDENKEERYDLLPLEEIMPSPVSTPEGQNAKEIQILVVEDNDDLRTYLKENLSAEYHIIEATNGIEGFEEATSRIPDIVVTDLMMPGIDGIELCSRLKNDEKTSHIPVIMLTSKTTVEDKIEGIESGADDYITKPFRIAEIKARIINLLEQREKLRKKFSTTAVFESADWERSSMDEQFMKKVISCISEHLSTLDFDVGSLQEMMGMSRMHLFRKMKAITGMTPSMFIRTMRLKRAAQLLEQKAGNITEIACEVGFYNPSHFTKCFREAYGVNPKDYGLKQS
jgi:signal transduction histidine kinase/DNA-binding response OmpR family regulator/ligand-binding sensor domain-containing protein